MIAYIVRRLFQLVIVLIGVTIITFLIMFAIPGDPAQQRYNLYAQAEKLILTDMPAAPLYYYRDYRVTNNRIGGFVFNPMGFIDMWTLWVK